MGRVFKPELRSSMRTTWLSYFTDGGFMTAVSYFIRAKFYLRKAYADLFATTRVEAFTVGALSLRAKTIVLRLSAQARSLHSRRPLQVIKEDAEHMEAPNPLLITTVFGPITLPGY